MIDKNIKVGDTVRFRPKGDGRARWCGYDTTRTVIGREGDLYRLSFGNAVLLATEDELLLIKKTSDGKV